MVERTKAMEARRHVLVATVPPAEEEQRRFRSVVVEEVAAECLRYRQLAQLAAPRPAVLEPVRET
jgi:hypothetical protein